MKIRRKVICVYGKWGKETDFVLEPVYDYEDEKDLKKNKIGKIFWIEEVEEMNRGAK